VLAGAVVVESGGTAAVLANYFRAALRGWVVWAAGKVALLESNVVEHSLDDRDVLGLAAVRCARDSELLFTPTERIESAGGEKRNYLKWFGAGSPVSKGVGVAGGAKKLVAFSNYCRVYTMLRFGAFTASDSDVELV
jgi:hypothetical protein